MNVIVYIYKQFVPVNGSKLFRCQECNRAMFKYTCSQIMIANIAGSTDMFPPSQHWIEIQCHSCKSLHKILFQ